jgi:hypothetical protein
MVAVGSGGVTVRTTTVRSSLPEERGVVPNPVAGRNPAAVTFMGDIEGARAFLPLGVQRLGALHAGNINDLEILDTRCQPNASTLVDCSRRFDLDSISIFKVPGATEQTTTTTMDSSGEVEGIVVGPWEEEG